MHATFRNIKIIYTYKFSVFVSGDVQDLGETGPSEVPVQKGIVKFYTYTLLHFNSCLCISFIEKINTQTFISYVNFNRN